MCVLQIAGIMEFIGAMVLGGEVTKTIATDIANVGHHWLGAGSADPLGRMCQALYPFAFCPHLRLSTMAMMGKQPTARVCHSFVPPQLLIKR